MNYYCCTQRRRNAIKVHPTLNGIDFLEVVDRPEDPVSVRQTVLMLHFLKPVDPASLSEPNILIKGGERVENIQVLSILPSPSSSPPNPTTVFAVRVSIAGDYSTYTLCLVQDNQDSSPSPLSGYDRLLSNVDFSFKVACANEFDCKTESTCVEELEPAPPINYLAKDYASFRQLMLDRLSLLTPNWKERNTADLGITLVELLAYTADYLSYRQDALSSEAYLETARKRISVRRHARLVDYLMHDGCNARTWLHIEVGAGINGLELKKEQNGERTKVFTKINGFPKAFGLGTRTFEEAIQSNATVFELMEDIRLYHLHNQMQFYTYGEEECCLPKGATEATLIGHFPDLKVEDILIFAEVVGPDTGVKQDANPANRHVVRLIEVSLEEDIDVDYFLNATPSSPPLSPPETGTIAITRIRWQKEDALPFPLCISHKGENYVENVSIAYGNVVLVDHGLTTQDNSEKSSLNPDRVPEKLINYIPANQTQDKLCESVEQPIIPPRYNPILKAKPLTFAVELPKAYRQKAASSLMHWEVKDARPAISLTEDTDANLEWLPKRDLLIDSSAEDRHFVVEVESDGVAHIRFGNDKNGSRPNRATPFLATYRIGNGIHGNIGTGTLAHIATPDPTVLAAINSPESNLWNPLPARGGQEAESMEEVRQYAPEAFRTQERAVTSEDYELFAKKCKPDIQRATAKLRWTGSWRTVFVSADRMEGKKVDTEFEEELRDCLEQYRMAGYDLEIDNPIPVSLEVVMTVCVLPDYFRGTVKKELLSIFSTGLRPDGQLGLFHPDNFSFGQPVYLSTLYAAAQSVQGVQSVEITTFQRQGDDNTSGIEDGKLLFGRREIPRLDNDPNFRDRGILNLIMQGGR